MSTDQKSLIFLRGWLAGNKYHTASRALDFAQSYHTGLRKDGVTPEFSHIVCVTQYVRTLSGNLIDPEATLAVALLHDVVEDYDVPRSVLVDQFGADISESVEALTKVFRKVKKSPEQYFYAIGSDSKASIVKGADRIHNFQSMIDVFSTAKQVEYLEEAETHILPMLKRARHISPQQECAYENIKYMLLSQISLVRSVHNATAIEQTVRVELQG